VLASLAVLAAWLLSSLEHALAIVITDAMTVMISVR
jgi:hypothetical protein